MGQLDQLLIKHGLTGRDWVPSWSEWLRRSGVLTRLPAGAARVTLTTTVQVLARVLGEARVLDEARVLGDAELPIGQLSVGLAELASEVTGDAHGLDDGVPAAALVLRALAFTLDCAPRGRRRSGGCCGSASGWRPMRSPGP